MNNIDEKQLMTDFNSTLQYHINNPGISADQYIRNKDIELGTHVMKMGRVYLDQNYWIYCRDVALGNPRHPDHKQLFEMLVNGVECGKIICPASHTILEETLKQDDDITKNLTADIVQRLSKGITLQPFEVLFDAEIRHFLYSQIHSKEALCAPEQLAWTYVGNIFSHLSPIIPGCDQNTQNAFRKYWYDFMSTISFQSLIKLISSSDANVPQIRSEFYAQQNYNCKIHENDYSSFKQVLLIEVKGVLDVYKENLKGAMLYLYEKGTGHSSKEISKDDSNKYAGYLANIIYHAFNQNKMSTQLPRLHIMSGIHAAIRYNKQKHHKGDIEDHNNACFALPYCDVFLTEKNLGHLLTTKPLNYNELYKCRVEWEPHNALLAIEELLGV